MAVLKLFGAWQQEWPSWPHAIKVPIPDCQIPDTVVAMPLCKVQVV
jgi:hypothetical protein